MTINRDSIWFKGAIWALRIIAIIVVVGSALSMTASEQWWIRMWDFPRIQFVMVMAIIAGLLWYLDAGWKQTLPILLLLFAAWQFYRVLPYTPMSGTEVAMASEAQSAGDQCFSAMSFNVFQDNRDYDQTIAMLEREDPDILLLLETDEKWLVALEPFLTRYPERLNRPIDNTYGLLFATRLPMQNATVQDLAMADTPSVYATLGGNRQFRLIGLHPRPPSPGQDTEERDAELVMAARHAEEQSMPVLAIGDFNDVAWSNTSRLFTRIGEFLDPRIGRGAYATFPADKTWLGWPLDHLFMTEEFLLKDMKVLENVGSDHRPVMAELCLAPEAGKALNDAPDAAGSEDRQDADTIIDEYEADSSSDHAS